MDKGIQTKFYGSREDCLSYIKIFSLIYKLSEFPNKVTEVQTIALTIKILRIKLSQKNSLGNPPVRIKYN
ncbi:hypothetical protein BpHYR1_009043 [Brachionus plicatilis]|uniref:Uncharacterized protein n=1 Tax=Brachionus plicatilis TaxID=10195 RepID=A0A3M7RQP4_BRAPC|nr:hypothetical protein BpHYR1_009043 [Brachionus plicatilis]